MSANFTVYRQGAEAFKIESRVQGDIRKVTIATYKEAIMADDSITLTVLSTVPMDFKLRDYIIYRGKPYLLNIPPEVSIDTSRRFTYKLVFDGVMFELARTAFVLENGIGYEYYGTLAEFARLVADNMNRLNEWVEWTYNNIVHRARYQRSFYNTFMGVECYEWRINGAGGQQAGITTLITTSRHPNVGDTGYNVSGSAGYGTVTAVSRWSVDFPHAPSIPTEYSQPLVHVPPTEVSATWVGEGQPYEVYKRIIISNTSGLTSANQQAAAEHGTMSVAAAGRPSKLEFEYDAYYDVVNSGQDGYSRLADYLREHILNYTAYEQGFYPSNREIHAWFKAQPNQPSAAPSSATDMYVVRQEGFFIRNHKRRRNGWHQKMVGGVNTWVYEDYVVEDYGDDYFWFERNYTYKAKVLHDYQIDIPVESSETTGNDYPTESVLLSYDCHSCLAVLQDFGNHWKDWEWRVENPSVDNINGEMTSSGVIAFRRRPSDGEEDSFVGVTHNMGFGRKGGISAIRRRFGNDITIPSRVYFYGGTQNLPQYYRNTRLCLPSLAKEDSYMDFMQMENPFVLGLENTTCEQVVIFDDIFPANEPFVIKSHWGIAMVTDTVTNKVYLQLVIPKTELFDIIGKWERYDAYWPGHAVQFNITIAHPLRLTRNTVLKSGQVLPIGTFIPAGVTIEGTAYTQDTTIDTAITLSADTTIAENGMVLPVGTVLLQYTDLPNGQIVPDDELGVGIAYPYYSYPDFGEWLTYVNATDAYVDGEGRPNRARYILYFEGKSKYMNGADTPRFVFQSGDLGGYALTIHSMYEDTVVDGNQGEVDCYIIHLNVVSESNEEISDYHVPNADVICHHGDKFIIDNINMPAAYTYYSDGTSNDFSAEKALKKAAINYMSRTKAMMEHEIEVARSYVMNNGTCFDCFDNITFHDITDNGAMVVKRVVGVELDIVDGYKYKVTIGEGRRRRISSVISQIVIDQQPAQK